MISAMSEPRSAALRAALVEHVNNSQAVRRRRLRRVGIGVAVGTVLAGSGVAVAAVLLPPPGADVVTVLTDPVTVTRVGTSSVELGTPPESATTVELTLVCLSAGTFLFDDGAQMVCDQDDASSGSSMGTYTLPVTRGLHSVAISTAPSDAQWSLSAAYSTRQPTSWATNPAGLTYGVANEDGEPDLVAVEATNGEHGYVRRSDLDAANGTTAARSFDSPEDALEWQATIGREDQSIAVYAADGTTVVGVFTVSGADSQGLAGP